MCYFLQQLRLLSLALLLEVTLDFYKLSQAGLAYVQILPLITPKNVFIQNICGGVQ